MKTLHNKDLTDISASKFLGKNVQVREFYDSSLLVPVLRSLNREQYEISNSALPFVGYDVWHAYEFSVLCDNGVPVTRLLKMKYDCSSDYIIESKSLKLYLNSFNMTKIGSNPSDCLVQCKKIIEKDLSDVLKTKVEVNFLDANSKRVEIFEQFQNVTDFADVGALVVTHFNESAKLIKFETLNDEKSYYLTFDSLRSNCRVTHQPDFGDVFVYYKSKKHIIESSLIEYLISFRREYHFHEECCEMIYKRLYDILDKNDELFVCALYTRRGGIDICPVRMSKNCSVNFAQKLVDLTCFARCGIKQ